MIYLIALLWACVTWFIGPIELITIGVVIFIIGIIAQLCTYYNHTVEIEKIKEKKKDIESYRKQADDLLVEIKLFLIDKFPEHELKIFDKITKNTVDFLAVDYPEIKSDECFMKAVNSIIEYKNKIYISERSINRLERQLAVRKRTVKLTVLPILPKIDI